MESSSSLLVTDKKLMVIDKLSRGFETADQLRAALLQTHVNNGLVVLLVDKILSSFTESISILSNDNEFDHNNLTCVSDMVNSLSEKTEDSCESWKKVERRDQRGCHKRRKNSELIKDTPSLFEDEHAWRKYGQKVILNAKHPRSYYRCTHKNEQKCEATKHVQKIQDAPPIFRTTYNGNHTCKDLSNSPYHITLDSPPDDSTTMWNFEGPVMNPAVSAVKQEEEDSFEIDNSNDYYHYLSTEIAATIGFPDIMGFGLGDSFSFGTGYESTPYFFN